MQETKLITSYRQSLKERIVAAAMELFAHYGVKAVKMIENGQLVIIKNGVKYNAQGTIVK